MRILKFTKWWWQRHDEFDRTTACVILAIIPVAISGIWIGSTAATIIAFGLAATVAGWMLYGIFYTIRNMWNTFNDEMPTQEEEVIRRLKGIPTPSNRETEAFFND